MSTTEMHSAPAPLFRDPIHDGAADPVVVWNREEKTWWILYTQRRANVDTPGVAYCYGTAVGAASSNNHGQYWLYRGSLNLEFERGHNTFWAPDVVYHDRTYHMFVSYIRGVHSHWGGSARIAHCTSRNLWDWKYEGFLKLSSDRVIDATLAQTPEGTWRIWYKDETRGSVTMTAESDDLTSWRLDPDPAIGGDAHEGPKVFRYGGCYWMLTDEWAGMRVYRSEDCRTWERHGRVLEGASSRPEDGPSGAHGDVIVVEDRAYVFYFTHPGRSLHLESEPDADGVVPYSQRRSSLQAAKLEIVDGTLVCDRDRPFDFWLPDLTE